MKRIELKISVEARCENCLYSYVEERVNEYRCSKSLPHKEVEEDYDCSSWKINPAEGFECLAWSDVKLVK